MAVTEGPTQDRRLQTERAARGHEYSGLAAGALALILGAACDAGREAGTGDRELRVAAAADLRPAVADLKAAFARVEPDVDVVFILGSSGGLLAQIENGAPFDVHLSADIGLARRLAAAGAADSEGVFAYARGQIAIWIPDASPVRIEETGLAGLADPAVRRIAVADPSHAPYGRAAIAALESAGIGSVVKDRLVFGDTAAQAAQFLESGAADAGVIALSLALSPALRDRGRCQVLPADSHPPIEQGGVVLGRARHPRAAAAFRRFLLGSAGREVLSRHGFIVPPE